MDVSALIERAARIVWRHKSLAALGVLDVILTSSGLMARAIEDLSLQLAMRAPEIRWLLLPGEALAPPPLVSIGQIGGLYRRVAPYGAGGWIGLIAGGAILLIALAVIGIVVEGGIVAAADGAEEGRAPSARAALASGWRRALPMVIIASVPAIPPTAGGILVIATSTIMVQNAGGLAALGGDPALTQQVIGQLALLGLAILCPLGLIALPLALLGVLAYRACMLEELGATASFRRAWEVLRARPGPVLVLVAVSYGVSILADTLSALPGLLATLFLPAVILVWLIQGAARAFYLTLWTLGWRGWAARQPEPAVRART